MNISVVYCSSRELYIDFCMTIFYLLPKIIIWWLEVNAKIWRYGKLAYMYTYHFPGGKSILFIHKHMPKKLYHPKIYQLGLSVKLSRIFLKTHAGGDISPSSLMFDLISVCGWFFIQCVTSLNKLLKQNIIN